MTAETSPGYSITMRLRIEDRAGMFAKIASAIGACEGNLGAVDLVSSGKGHKVRDVSVDCRDEPHARRILDSVRGIQGVELLRWLDRVFMMHLGGKLRIAPKVAIRDRDALSMAYTPGVARVCRAIAADPRRAYRLTIKQNSVAVVTDGTAVLGLGDLGPAAALPVMEGKAILFREFGDIDAYPICLDTKDTEEIIRICHVLAPQFGGINLEDISAPRCFEIETRLKRELDIPVFHDDQHGTAVVAMAALANALKIVGKRIEDLRVVVSGAGAAGVSCVRSLLHAGAGHVVCLDRAGILHRGRNEHMNPVKQWIAEHTNAEGLRGTLEAACRGADLFLGVSAPGLLTVEHLRSMTGDPIVFALANPDPEIAPVEAEPFVRIMATGRSDYPNQINNVLCFPGLFRGCLDVQARDINEEMKAAASTAIASAVEPEELSEDYIVPSVFNRRVAKVVAAAVAAAAIATGAARKEARAEQAPDDWESGSP
jgi:malate dehydrogenase (oxaloacetate-decarboxylating)